MTIKRVATTPFTDQKPGTSGIRKKTKVFMQERYLENYVQSVLGAISGAEGGTLIIGGDGRYFNRSAIQTIVKIAVAAKVARVLVGVHGLISTPAMSHLIRLNGAWGGFILSASHNPGGVDKDFGVKFNIGSGGPSTDAHNDEIFKATQSISEYFISDSADIDLDAIGDLMVDGVPVSIIDGVSDYADLMQSLFDFTAISGWLSSHSMVFDAMNGATGPYARRIFCDILGVPAASVRRADPLEDFGGGHPDPNPANMPELMELMYGAGAPDFAAASDGDGDRNLICGRGQFVSPSDSVALIAAGYWCVPAYRKGLLGVARSMPTSQAIDIVAKFLSVPYYETPTGWKYFGNLMDAERVTFCGEESFGSGSNHIREKDGLWAVLYWLNMLAARGMTVKELVEDHWRKFGRNYYCRHDYEGLPTAKADALMERLRNMLGSLIGAIYGEFHILKADDFAYTDPTDGSVARNQGIRLCFADGSRIVMRLSGTGTEGATLRVYLERFTSVPSALFQETNAALAPLADVAAQIADFAGNLGKSAPDVVV
ncbi:alpha-D-glucose phosphate-specific phosphoglucomutase [Alphaproteobacteria bacterium]|nr:alpha-D-glucose phosphate-specific phosphoglucomutase [Alphaproteobacteria bacterium]